MSWHCKKYSLLYNTLTSNQKAIKSTNKNRVWEKVTSLPFLEKFPIKIGAGAIYLEAVLQMPNEILARKLLYRQAGEASPTPPYNHSYKKPALRYRMGRATAAPQVKQKNNEMQTNQWTEHIGGAGRPVERTDWSHQPQHRQANSSPPPDWAKNIAITLLRICVEELDVRSSGNRQNTIGTYISDVV